MLEGVTASRSRQHPRKTRSWLRLLGEAQKDRALGGSRPLCLATRALSPGSGRPGPKLTNQLFLSGTCRAIVGRASRSLVG